MNLAGLVGGLRFGLARHREAVGAFLGQLRKTVVQTLSGLAHAQRCGVDQLLGDESRIRLEASSDGVVSHVLNAASNGDVVGAHGDSARNRGGGRHGTRAPAVNRIARNAQRQTGKDAHGSSENESLIAGLRGRSQSDFVDGSGRNLGVALEKTDDGLSHDVVGPSGPEDAFFAGPTKGRANAVDECDPVANSHENSFVVLVLA